MVVQDHLIFSRSREETVVVALDHKKNRRRNERATKKEAAKIIFLSFWSLHSTLYTIPGGSASLNQPPPSDNHPSASPLVTPLSIPLLPAVWAFSSFLRLFKGESSKMIFLLFCSTPIVPALLLVSLDPQPATTVRQPLSGVPPLLTPLSIPPIPLLFVFVSVSSALQR